MKFRLVYPAMVGKPVSDYFVEANRWRLYKAVLEEEQPKPETRPVSQERRLEDL
jgi:hypothetical protein